MQQAPNAANVCSIDLRALAQTTLTLGGLFGQQVAVKCPPPLDLACGGYFKPLFGTAICFDFRHGFRTCCTRSSKSTEFAIIQTNPSLQQANRPNLLWKTMEFMVKRLLFGSRRKNHRHAPSFHLRRLVDPSYVLQRLNKPTQ